MKNKAEKFSDTIAALSSPSGRGAVSIIRLSGPDSLTTLKKIFLTKNKTPFKEIKPRYLHYGLIVNNEEVVNPADSIIDDVTSVFLQGEASYTGEDTVEIFCHGNPLITNSILELIYSHGIRPADPGEFTKRAYLNGKMDLAEAEAVSDLINAETSAALKSAEGQKRGTLSKKIFIIKDIIFNLAALIEAELDFSEEEEVERISNEEVTEKINKASKQIEKLIHSYNSGRIIKDGAKTLILGRPNSGKSSLLNALLKEERAIVTDIAGTTRDIIEDTASINGIAFRIMDTAGLRETADKVEKLGIKAAIDRVKEALLLLYVIDASEGGEGLKEDLKNLGDLKAECESLKDTYGSKHLLVVMNKTDLCEGNENIKPILELFEPCFVSAKEGTTQNLEKAMVIAVTGEKYDLGATSGESVTTLRHRDSLIKARERLAEACSGIEEGVAREFTAESLREALDALSEVTGETTADDILNHIFDSFCIGK